MRATALLSFHTATCLADPPPRLQLSRSSAQARTVQCAHLPPSSHPLVLALLLAEPSSHPATAHSLHTCRCPPETFVIHYPPAPLPNESFPFPNPAHPSMTKTSNSHHPPPLGASTGPHTLAHNDEPSGSQKGTHGKPPAHSLVNVPANSPPPHTSPTPSPTAHSPTRPMLTSSRGIHWTPTQPTDQILPPPAPPPPHPPHAPTHPHTHAHTTTSSPHQGASTGPPLARPPAS